MLWSPSWGRALQRKLKGSLLYNKNKTFGEKMLMVALKTKSSESSGNDHDKWSWSKCSDEVAFEISISFVSKLPNPYGSYHMVHTVVDNKGQWPIGAQFSFWETSWPSYVSKIPSTRSFGVLPLPHRVYGPVRYIPRPKQLSSPSGEADSMTGLMDAVIIPSPDGISAPTPFFFGFSVCIVSSRARNSRPDRTHSNTLPRGYAFYWFSLRIENHITKHCMFFKLRIKLHEQCQEELKLSTRFPKLTLLPCCKAT